MVLRQRLDPLPAVPATVGTYLASLAGRLAAIATAHRHAGHRLDIRHPAIFDLLRGIRRVHGAKQRRAAPATTGVVQAMVQTCDESPLGQRDRALLLVGFAAALRRSEIAALDTVDIAFAAEGMRVTIRRSKMDHISSVTGSPWISNRYCGARGLVSAVRLLFDVVKEGVGNPKARRRAWFDDHIKPSYDELVPINADYHTQFQKAADLLREHANLQEVVTILKKDRPEKLLERQEVRENLRALRAYRLTKTRKPKLAILFYDYVRAVETYLSAASPIPRKTWYSRFIDEFSALVEKERDPFNHDYPTIAQGRSAPQLAIRKLDEAVSKNMPEALREVQEAYAKLRVECLADL